jgi:hypothetical protein
MCKAIAPAASITAGIAKASLPKTATPWEEYAADYNRLRDKMAEAIEDFECFNRRVRQPLGFRLKQPARELIFLTDTGRANFSSPVLADAAPKAGRLLLGTVRSHDQWNTTIYSDDDRYRGVKNLRTLVFMNEDDMKDRRLQCSKRPASDEAPCRRDQTVECGGRIIQDVRGRRRRVSGHTSRQGILRTPRNSQFHSCLSHRRVPSRIDLGQSFLTVGLMIGLTHFQVRNLNRCT